MDNFKIEKYRNYEIESEMLGILICDAIKYHQAISDGIDTSYFFKQSHKECFNLIKKLYLQYPKITSLLVAQQLNEDKMSYPTLMVSEVIAISTSVTTTAMYESYYKILHDMKLTRELQGLMDSVRTSDKKGQELLDEIQAKIIALTDVKTKEATTEDELFGSFESLQYRMYNKDVLLGIDTGYQVINKAIGGLQAGHIGTVFGRSGLGKTTFVTSLLKNGLLSKKRNGKFLMFSMEMPPRDIIDKLISNISGVPYTEIRNPHLLAEQQEKQDAIARAYETLHKVKENFEIHNDTDINTIISKATSYKLRKGLDVLIVDYLNIATGKTGNHTDSIINQITRALKEFALKHKVHVVMLTQCKREVDTRQDKRPIVADIKDSSSIEQNSDYIIGLYRNLAFDDKMEREKLRRDAKIDYNTNNADYNPEVLEANFLKNRYGARDRTFLKWEGEYSRVNERGFNR